MDRTPSEDASISLCAEVISLSPYDGAGTRKAKTTNDFEIAKAVAAISAASNPAACERIFQQAVQTFDVGGFACGEVDFRVPERTVFYAFDWPKAWRDFYLQRGFQRRDPLVDALKLRREPFTWSELRRDRKWSSIGTQGLQIITEQGWTEGLAVPIPRTEDRFGLVSLYFRDRILGADDKSVLAMLSYCFHERLRNLAPRFGFALPPAGLTKREIETLRLIALGATDREVGRKLGISPSTAHEHFENAKAKLKVSTRAEAIALAVSLAIVAA
jgi:LuxR family quorum-sensing system transcriptional regulator CciR